MKRIGVAVVVAMVGSLIGCGGSGGSDGPGAARAPQRADAARTTATKTFSLVGEAVQALSYSSSGAAGWTICGMEPSPSGAEYVAELAITQSNTGASEQAALISSSLASAGWKVEQPTADLVEASKDGLTFRADRGTNLSISSGCVDLPEDEVRRLTDEPRDDLGISTPS